MNIKKLSDWNRLIDNKFDCKLYTDWYVIEEVHFIPFGDKYVKEHIRTIENTDKNIWRRTEKKFFDIIKNSCII